MYKCKVCNKVISQERVQHFADLGKSVDTCVKHSNEERTIGLMIYGHKTAGSVVLVPKEEDGTYDPNKVDKAFRGYWRAR